MLLLNKFKALNLKLEFDILKTHFVYHFEVQKNKCNSNFQNNLHFFCDFPRFLSTSYKDHFMIKNFAIFIFRFNFFLAFTPKADNLQPFAAIRDLPFFQSLFSK